MRDNYDFPLTNPIGEGVHCVLNAFYVGFLGGTVEIEDILYLPHDSEYERVRESFNRAFFDEDIGLYVDREGSAHSATRGQPPRFPYCSKTCSK